MKTKVEINGYEIDIEFVDGVINVVASKEGDPVEEFSIETEESAQGEGAQDAEEIQAFGEFDEEEDFEGQGEEEDDDEFEGQGEEEDDDFEGQGEEDDDDDDEMQDEEKSMAALESFQAFINKTKKRK